MSNADKNDIGYLQFLRIHTRNVLTMLKRSKAEGTGYYKQMTEQYKEAEDLLKELGIKVSSTKDCHWKISYNNGTLRLSVGVI